MTLCGDGVLAEVAKLQWVIGVPEPNTSGALLTGDVRMWAAPQGDTVGGWPRRWVGPRELGGAWGRFSRRQNPPCPDLDPKP